MSRTTSGPLMRLMRAAGGVSAFSIIGQLILVAAIPVFTRLYSPADFGVFTIYLAIVNILGAIAALRYEPYLYIVHSRAEAHVAGKLIILSICATSIVAGAGAYFVLRSASDEMHQLVCFIPVGMALGAVAETMNCWTLRFGALRDFAIGRIVQPVSMALLQIAFGVAEGGGGAMMLAHILSQAVLIAYFCVRVFGWQDLREIGRAPWAGVTAAAKSEYKFPLFDLPANLAGYAIINVPTLLIGSLFGSAFAGFFGVAARLTSGPTTLMAAPLSTVFVAEASKVRDIRSLRNTARILLVLTGVVISLPVLVMGVAAPYLVGPLLGEAWLQAGQIMVALAVMGAAQALSTPLQEVPTLLRRQEVRLAVDAVRMALVFGPLIAGARAGWGPLSVIYVMAVGGTLGFLLRTASSLYLLRHPTGPRAPVTPTSRAPEIRTVAD